MQCQAGTLCKSVEKSIKANYFHSEPSILIYEENSNVSNYIPLIKKILVDDGHD